MPCHYCFLDCHLMLLSEKQFLLFLNTHNAASSWPVSGSGMTVSLPLLPMPIADMEVFLPAAKLH